MENITKTPLQLAISAVGSKSELARKMGVTAQAIQNMEKRGGFLPTKRAIQMASITGLPIETLYPQMNRD